MIHDMNIGCPYKNLIAAIWQKVTKMQSGKSKCFESYMCLYISYRSFLYLLKQKRTSPVYTQSKNKIASFQKMLRRWSHIQTSEKPNWDVHQLFIFLQSSKDRLLRLKKWHTLMSSILSSNNFLLNQEHVWNIGRYPTSAPRILYRLAPQLGQDPWASFLG